MTLSVNNITFSYPKHEVLRNISFATKKGEMVCILGPNGTGKTTLLKCLNKILKPSMGTVLIDDIDINTLGGNELSKRIGYVEQQRSGSSCTVFNAVLLGRKPYIRWDVTPQDVEIAARALEKLNMSGYSRRLLRELSGGELQKVIIARSLAQEPQVLLMDEPTNHLDLKNQLDVLKTIKKITQDNQINSIITMHDLNLALSYGDKFILMKDQGIYAAGGQECITPENILKVYGVKTEIIIHKGKKIIVPLQGTNKKEALRYEKIV